MIQIVDKKINVAELLDSIIAPEAGGIDIFLGTTRNHSKGKKVIRLEYETYLPMALKLMSEIEREIRERWNIHKISMIHRTGVVPVMEASVAIAVSSAHRKEAFEACRYAIDELKKRVPIWKKEIFEDGEVWVENAESKIM
ncbi:MAG: molybdenum cofactor biosynthesis protein MoaE [Bacteroidota bacterium]